MRRGKAERNGRVIRTRSRRIEAEQKRKRKMAGAYRKRQATKRGREGTLDGGKGREIMRKGKGEVGGGDRGKKSVRGVEE